MMGRLNPDQEQLFYSFRLDEAVPHDHPVRKIAAVLDLERRKLVARGSRYAPMPSASLGEFNRIAVRIMSSHRTLPGLFVWGFEKNYSSGLQMFIQNVEIICSQFNMNPCSLLWRHADRSQRICAIVREQSNRAASRTSHADHCKLRGLVDLHAETEFASIEFYRALHVRDAQREPLQSNFQHGTPSLLSIYGDGPDAELIRCPIAARNSKSKHLARRDGSRRE
jgi:hypothetical protein